MQSFKSAVIALADGCLGGLRGRSALLIGPQEFRRSYELMLKQSGMKQLYHADTSEDILHVLPDIQLLLYMPDKQSNEGLSAITIAMGCRERHTPLLIFDLAESPSVENEVELLPMVCLYTPDDLRWIFAKSQRAQTMMAS